MVTGMVFGVTQWPGTSFVNRPVFRTSTPTPLINVGDDTVFNNDVVSIPIKIRYTED